MSKSHKTDAAHFAWKKVKTRIKSDAIDRANGVTNPVENTTWRDALMTGRRHGTNRKHYAKQKVYHRKVARLMVKNDTLKEIKEAINAE
jgi:hypothetical protein